MNKYLATTILALTAFPAAAATITVSGEIVEISDDFQAAQGIEVGSEYSVVVELDETADPLVTFSDADSTTRFYPVNSFSVSFENGFSETINFGPSSFVDITGVVPVGVVIDNSQDLGTNGDFDALGAATTLEDGDTLLGVFELVATDPSGQAFDQVTTLEQAIEVLFSAPDDTFQTEFFYDQFFGTSTGLGDCPLDFDAACFLVGDLSDFAFEPSPSAVPLSSSAGFLLAGLGGLALTRRRLK